MTLATDASEALAEAFRRARAFIGSVDVQALRWGRSQHTPVDLDGEGGSLVCRNCKEPWPCSRFVELDAEIASRSGEQPPVPATPREREGTGGTY